MTSSKNNIFQKIKSFFNHDNIAIIVLILFMFYLVAYCFLFDIYVPVYNPPKQQKFTGNSYYNPYEKYDNATYYRASFHTYAMDNLETYIDLEYGYAYSSISTKYKKLFPPVKLHTKSPKIAQPDFLVFNKPIRYSASKYAFPHLIIFTNYSSIQFMINSLIINKGDYLSALISPVANIDIKYMSKLTNYNLIEILYGNENSINHWDTALSSGRPAFLLASDKIDDDSDFSHFAKNITMLPVSPNTDNISEIYQALKAGSVYAYNLSDNITSLPLQDKLDTLNTLPYPTSLQIHNNELTVKFNKHVDKIVFSADFGKIVKEVENVSQAVYNITDNESYIRVTAYFDNGSAMYFNPVMKSENSMQPKMPETQLNYPLSILKWFVPAVIILCVIITIIYYIILEIIESIPLKWKNKWQRK